MFKGLGNFASLLRQAQEVGSKMQEVNEQLRLKRVTGSSAGGMIEVEANGQGEILRLKIDPTLDLEMIEDLVPAAVNQAQAKAKQLHMDAMQDMAGGLDVPGLNDAISRITGEKTDGA
jgi:DNA-binding YbaB/EbfC family protein